MKDVLTDLVNRGWVTGNLAEFDFEEFKQKFDLVAPSGEVENSTQFLSPKSQSDARPNSISAIHGLDAQPLHTDGANKKRPPAFIVLSSEQVNQTCTSVWDEFATGSYTLPRAAQGFGLAKVRGKKSFYSYVLEHGQLRLDPGCMEFLDEDAQRLFEYTKSIRDNCIKINWDTIGKFAIINNFSVLHGRDKVTEEDAKNRVIIRQSFWRRSEWQDLTD